MHQESLFEQATHEPLASRMRPQTLDQIVGQQHLLAPNQMLRCLIDAALHDSLGAAWRGQDDFGTGNRTAYQV